MGTPSPQATHVAAPSQLSHDVQASAHRIRSPWLPPLPYIVDCLLQLIDVLFIFIYLFIYFLGPYLQHAEVPNPGLKPLFQTSPCLSIYPVQVAGLAEKGCPFCPISFLCSSKFTPHAVSCLSRPHAYSLCLGLFLSARRFSPVLPRAGTVMTLCFGAAEV